MKSFADWTDEIRALMNPPAPMVDTCNFEVEPRSYQHNALELGTAIHTAWEKRLEDWPRTVGRDRSFFDLKTFGWDEGKSGGDLTATAIARKHRIIIDRVLHNGRQTSKSEMQRLLNDYGRLAENVSDAEWVEAYKDMVTIGTGAVRIIHDEFSTFDPTVFDTLRCRIMRKEPE